METELRRRLQEAPPEFIEKTVLDLLWKMGFGGAHGDKKHVGPTGDGGIDGVKLTALMLEYGIGVETAKSLTFSRVDEDFFNFDQL